MVRDKTTEPMWLLVFSVPKDLNTLHVKLSTSFFVIICVIYSLNMSQCLITSVIYTFDMS